MLPNAFKRLEEASEQAFDNLPAIFHLISDAEVGEVNCKVCEIASVIDGVL